MSAYSDPATPLVALSGGPKCHQWFLYADWWIEWLMGFPDGWTELPPSAPSSPPSPNASAA